MRRGALAVVLVPECGRFVPGAVSRPGLAEVVFLAAAGPRPQPEVSVAQELGPRLAAEEATRP